VTHTTQAPDPARTPEQAKRVFDWIGSPALAYEHACFAVAQMREKGVRPSRARLEAALFIADVLHLNEYGRPLYGENWSAGWSGPVPSILGSVLDGDVRLEGMIRDEDVRCIAFARDSLGSPDGFVHAFREPNLRKISQSDQEAIAEAVSDIASLDPCSLIQMLRFHPAQFVGVGNRIPPTAMLKQDDPHLAEMAAQIEEMLPYVSFLRPLDQD
jgi:hypothetical protein